MTTANPALLSAAGGTLLYVIAIVALTRDGGVRPSRPHLSRPLGTAMILPRPRQLLVAGSVVAGIALGASGDYGSSTTANTRIVPDDRFFTIWGPIYLGALTYAAHQARSFRRDDPALARVAAPAAGAYLASGLWVHTLERTPTPIGLTLIVGTTAAAIRAAAIAPDGRHDPWLVVRAPLGLFAGWLSLATVVAGAELVTARGVRALGTDAAGAAALAVTTAAGIAVAAATDVPATYLGAIAFGLTGVAVAPAPRSALLRTVAAVGAIATALVATARGATVHRTTSPRMVPTR